MADNDQIKLVLFQGTGSIWNTRDWKKTRESKIIGTFVGSVAQQPYQVKEKGFPLLLTKNETTLLLEKGLATLMVSKNISDCPDKSINDRYEEAMTVSFSKQSELLQEERKCEILERSELIVTGKVKKRRKLDPDYVLTESDRGSIITEQISKISKPSQSVMFVEISTEDPWLEESSWQTCDWNYPETQEEKLQYATFRSLWENGYWVTPGAKFGGNFLAYHGDPLIFHSSYIVRCTKRDETFDLLNLVTLARLANSTNKIPVLAYFDSNNHIAFQSINWIS